MVQIISISSEEEFKNLVSSSGDKLVLIDFYATWCGPCKVIAPKLEEFAQTYSEKLIIAKVDVDQLEDLAMEQKVSAMPTFHLFKNGENVGVLTGANKEKLEELIKKHI